MSLKSLVFLASALTGSLVSAKPYPAKPVAPADLPITIVAGPSKYPDELELTATRAIVFEIQGKLGQRAYADLVKNEVDVTDAYWHERAIALNNTPLAKQPAPRLSLTKIQAFADPKVFNATTLFDWSGQAGVGYMNGLMHTNPQHRATYAGAGIASADLDYTGFEEAFGIQMETWGNSTLNSTVFYGLYQLNATEKPSFMPALDDYPLQFISAQKIRDGTLFGWTLKAVKDLATGDGVELWMGTWILGNSAQWLTDGLTAHNTHEFTETMRLAYAWGLGLDYNNS